MFIVYGLINKDLVLKKSCAHSTNVMIYIFIHNWKYMYLNMCNMSNNDIQECAIFHKYFYTPVERRDVFWYGPVRPSVCLSVRPFTIACERDILKTACQIDFIF